MTDTPGANPQAETEQDQPMQDVAESMMSDFMADMTTNHPHLEALKAADTHLIQGLPPGRIVEVAGLLKAKMIVIGSR